MPNYVFNGDVTLRKAVLDPQGKAVHNAARTLGYTSIAEIRIGKHIEITCSAENETDERKTVEELAGRLLANPVTEDFRVELRRDHVDAHRSAAPSREV